MVVLSALTTKSVTEEEMLREMVFTPVRPAGIVATAAWLVAAAACDVMTDGWPVTTPKLLVCVRKVLSAYVYVVV